MLRAVCGGLLSLHRLLPAVTGPPAPRRDANSPSSPVAQLLFQSMKVAPGLEARDPLRGTHWLAPQVPALILAQLWYTWEK